MLKSQKLVIIDDEEDLLELMEYYFSTHGYEVHAFNRAAKAWDYIKEERPDLILCDWMMPGLSGIEFCKKLKSKGDFSDIPFVMLSCRSEETYIKKALNEGVNAYISKPIAMPELLSRVRQIFTISQDIRRL